MSLYHYTTESRYKSILDDKKLEPSTDTTTDAVAGQGWYFTDLPPDTCEKILMNYCWERTTLHRRVDCYFELQVQGAQTFSVKEHVYFVPLKENVYFSIISQGRTHECPLKPCSSCHVNPES